MLFRSKLDDFIRYLRELAEFDFQNKQIVKNCEILINKIKRQQDKIKKIIYKNEKINSKIYNYLYGAVSDIYSDKIGRAHV